MASYGQTSGENAYNAGYDQNVGQNPPNQGMTNPYNAGFDQKVGQNPQNPVNAGYNQNGGQYPQNQGPPNPYSAGYNQPPPPAYTPNPHGYPGSQGYPAGQGYPTGHPGYGPPPPVVQQPQHHTTTNVVVTNNSCPSVLFIRRRFHSDYLVPAILACFFCSPLTGIPAIIAACIARDRFDNEDIEGGRSSARWALGLTLLSVFLGVGCYILLVVLSVSGSRSDNYNGY